MKRPGLGWAKAFWYFFWPGAHFLQGLRWAAHFITKEILSKKIITKEYTNFPTKLKNAQLKWCLFFFTDCLSFAGYEQRLNLSFLRIVFPTSNVEFSL